MLRISTDYKRGKLTLSVEGRLVGQWVGALEQCWRELTTKSPKQKFSVNLCGVSYIDNSGKVLLREMHRQGGELLAEGCLNQCIIREIVGDSENGAQKEDEAEKPGQGKSGIIFYSLFFLMLMVPGVTQAQTSLPAAAPTEPLKLTLEQAVTLALRQNPTAQIALISAAESVQDKNIARAAFLPQADFRVADSANRANLAAQFGGKVPPGFPHHIGPYQIFSAGSSFSSSVIDLSLWKRYQAAGQGAEASKANSLSTREQVLLLVVSQYIGSLRAVANVQASKSRVDLAQALYDQAADLQKEGVGTGIDTLRANVELQNEKQRNLEANNELNQSLFRLSRLLNLDPRQKIELADALSFLDTPQPDVNTSIDAALATREEWKAMDAQMKAARYQKQAEEYTRLPSMHFDGYWNYLGTSASNGIPTYQYQASVRMPLFTSGRIRAEVTKANLEIRALEQQQADLRNEIALEVKNALLNLESARNEVEVANLGVQLANDEVSQARDRFQAGVANNIEVISAQDSLSRANDNQIAALYRFNQARADYARAIGQMEKLYSH